MFWMLPGGATRVAQLEHAMQKQAHVLSELQRLLRMDTPPPQVHRLAARVERLDMQLAELCTQVQADDQARELLNRLSGDLLKPCPPLLNPLSWHHPICNLCGLQ